MSQTFKYKEYHGSIEVSLEDNCLAGQVLFIRDTVLYSGETVQELQSAFEEAVDHYLEHCKKTGKKPDTPFSGTFNVRIGAERHKHLAKKATLTNSSLNDMVCKAIELYLSMDDSASNRSTTASSDQLLLNDSPERKEKNPPPSAQLFTSIADGRVMRISGTTVSHSFGPDAPDGSELPIVRFNTISKSPGKQVTN